MRRLVFISLLCTLAGIASADISIVPHGPGLDFTPERLRVMLREEDFLGHQRGQTKPVADPLRYVAPDAAAKARAAEIRVMTGVLMPAETTASAATQEGVSEPRDWTLLLLPYVWLPNNDLTIQTEAYRQSEFTTIEDALRQVDYGGLLFVELHRGKSAIYADAMYVRLSGESREQGLRTRSDIRQAMIEVAGVRRYQGARHGIEFLAGLRYFHLNSDVDVQIAGTFDDSFHWVEPIVGLRHRMRLSERWHYDWRADFGGFDVGSRFTWQLVTNLHYDISDSYSVNIGYRHMDIDYRDGARRYESTLSGPMLGVSFKF